LLHIAFTKNQLEYLAIVDRFLIEKEAAIPVAKLAIDYLVQGLKDLDLWLSVAPRSYFKNLKQYIQSQEDSSSSLER
jgi:hypothetical protein